MMSAVRCQANLNCSPFFMFICIFFDDSIIVLYNIVRHSNKKKIFYSYNRYSFLTVEKITGVFKYKIFFNVLKSLLTLICTDQH